MNCEILFNSQKKVIKNLIWKQITIYMCTYKSSLLSIFSYFMLLLANFYLQQLCLRQLIFARKVLKVNYQKILISRTFDGWFVGISISDGEAVANLTENFLQANKIWFTVLNFSNIKSNFKFPVVFFKLFKSWYFKKVLKLHWFKQWKTLNCLN